MLNSKIDATWEYHNSTKHSLDSVRSERHYLDWSNQPRSYKLYRDLNGFLLSKELAESNFPALSAISQTGTLPDRESIPDLNNLTSILHYSAGITKRFPTLGGEITFRAAACTGALYHIELYLICGKLPDMESGVYHFSVPDMTLEKLRSGDYRGILTESTGEEASIVAAPVIVVCTSTYWRNSWKYQSRTYRHCFWDSGTILANMLAVASGYRLPARVVTGFVDKKVNRLLDLDDQREVALSLVHLGIASSMPPGPSPEVDRLNLETVLPSRTEVEYPAINKMHAASSLSSLEEVMAWRAASQPTPVPTPLGNIVRLRPLEPAVAPQDSIERVIRRRGSSRHFEQRPISFKDLSSILSSATQGIPADFLSSSDVALNDLYLIVNAVDGLDSGTYLFHRGRQALELLRAGDFRREAGYLALGQNLGGDASVNIYFLADLEPLLKQFGNRGYRIAQLDASITAGKIYLAAYALGLGVTGLTFFDDDVTSFFSPHAQGKSVMFLTALGIAARRKH